MTLQDNTTLPRTTTTSVPPEVAAASAPSGTGALSLASFILGLVSVLAGWLFFAPLLGIILGIRARSREPQSRTLGTWGIVLSAIMLSVWVIALILLTVFGAFALFVAAVHR